MLQLDDTEKKIEAVFWMKLKNHFVVRMKHYCSILLKLNYDSVRSFIISQFSFYFWYIILYSAVGKKFKVFTKCGEREYLDQININLLKPSGFLTYHQV